MRDAIRALCRLDPLTAEEEVTLGRRVRQGDAGARERFILCNQRLVVAVARRYRRACRDILDLISSGNIGLHIAVDRFDPERGCRFSTFATWFIRDEMLRFLNEMERTIRLPSDVAYALLAVQRAAGECLVHTGERPSAQDLAQETGMAAERVETVLQAGKRVAHLDAGTGAENGGSLHASTADPHAEASPERAAAHETRDMVLHAVAGLTGLRAHEREAFLLVSGLQDGVMRTPREAGALLGLHPAMVERYAKKVRRMLGRDERLRRLCGVGDAAGA